MASCSPNSRQLSIADLGGSWTQLQKKKKKVLPWPDIPDREDMRTEGDSQVNRDRPGPSLTFLVSSRKSSCLLFAPGLQYCPSLCFVCSPRHRRVPFKQWGL